MPKGLERLVSGWIRAMDQQRLTAVESTETCTFRINNIVALIVYICLASFTICAGFSSRLRTELLEAVARALRLSDKNFSARVSETVGALQGWRQSRAL